MKYTKEKLEEAVKASHSVANVIRYLGCKVAGGTHSHIKKLIIRYQIDTTHFTGQLWSKGKILPQARKSKEDILIVTIGDNRTKSHQLSRALIESGIEHKCKECGIGPVYNNKPIILHVDHIDGNWNDNRIINLRFLCPNCHSQTKTFGSKNKVKNV